MIPEQAIVIDESVTTGRGFHPLTAGAPPHDWLQNMGAPLARYASGSWCSSPARTVKSSRSLAMAVACTQYRPSDYGARRPEHHRGDLGNRTYQILKENLTMSGPVDQGRKPTTCSKSVVQTSTGRLWPLAWAFREPRGTASH